MDSRVNYVDFIKSVINTFLVIAVVISLFQELSFSSSQASPAQNQTEQPVAEIPTNGTKVEGLIIYTTDSFRKPFRDLLIEKQYNIEIKEFQFVGQEYWLNLFLTHGHILVVFFIVSRYQSEQNQGSKNKLMILGLFVVLVWLFLVPHLKTQRLGLEYQGKRVYQKDVFIPTDIQSQLSKYNELDTFGLQPEFTDIAANLTEKEVLEDPNTIIPEGQIHADF